MNRPILNIAAFQSSTMALGPGKRAAIWVQGCPFRCPGCIAPSWQENRTAQLIDPDKLARMILRREDIQGLTISGGEPMQQAAGLLRLVQAIKEVRDLDVICFSGYKIEVLRSNPPNRTVPEFLQSLDVLIDGLYIQERNNDQGLRGSTNQRIHHLSDRLRDFDFENSPRKVEMTLQGQEAFLVGVPTKPFLHAYERAFDQMCEMLAESNPPTTRSEVVQENQQTGQPKGR